MPFTTKAFGQFYKLFNPKNIPSPGWYSSSFITLVQSGLFGTGTQYSASYGPMSSSYVNSGNKLWFFSSSFLNYPGDPIVTDVRGVKIPGYSYLTTRDISASIYFQDAAKNPISMSAIPWGSQAGDFLWNVQTPSWSFVEENLEGVNYHTWTPTWTSNSFHSLYAPGGISLGIGTSSVYPVTSSWKIFDPKYIKFQYPVAVPSGINVPEPPFPSLPLTFATYSSCYKIHVNASGSVGQAAGLSPITDIDFFNEVNNAVFDLGGGAAITQAEVSASLAIMDVSGSSPTSAARRAVDRALRQRRLYFPITYSTSSAYWLKQFTGYYPNEMFTENGGIYNVRFTVKRWNKDWVASDSASTDGNVFYDSSTSDLAYNTGSWGMSTAYPAEGSYLNVFIHDVLSTVPITTQRVPGMAGWYPPATNIVTIGSGFGVTPIMSFQDDQTGYTQERFDIVLVQYGWPAQLCFEPSGSVAAPFGCIIDDIEVCKVGVTTDPRFIKPQTIAGVSSQTEGTTIVTITETLEDS